MGIENLLLKPVVYQVSGMENVTVQKNIGY
ncbi:hypothetical protein DEAC_c38230 [Desulfosporosinus acididurans]|uniref:Uncharacterized protein n=1 Tax=Desulfosporosinus acididurans TaxID=476652 RepID=A0A0J1FL34_9FIRM|nr:hypothetical protein DEAC_c38230 [Desulfosporosinus acididurans]